MVVAFRFSRACGPAYLLVFNDVNLYHHSGLL